MRTLAFIDNFINEPVYHCVNDFIQRTGLPCTYHQVSKNGTRSLESLEKPLGIIVLGSASHVHENLPWHNELILYLRDSIKKEIPLLGICFGHQLLASMYGGEVGYLPGEKKYDGIRTLEVKKSFWGFEAGGKLELSYAHEQIVTKMPNDFELLACTSELSYEFFRHKNLEIYSLQAHPEASLEYLSNQCHQAASVKEQGNKVLDQFYAHCKKLESKA